MTPEEKFAFDLQGFIVIKNALTPQEVEAINQVSDRVFPRDYADQDQARANFRRTEYVSKWDPACQRLIDHPNVTPYLEELLGPTFRLDHDYCIFMRRGARGGILHGGPETGHGAQYFRHHHGTLRNGLSVVTFFFSDAGPGDGGFICVPGSHKSNFLEDLPQDVRSLERLEPYVVQPVVQAGDALFFTEALVHGTAPWQAHHERRTFLYKYSPGHISWAPKYYRAEEYFEPTEQQRRILSPPSTGGREPSIAT